MTVAARYGERSGQIKFGQWHDRSEQSLKGGVGGCRTDAIMEEKGR